MELLGSKSVCPRELNWLSIFSNFPYVVVFQEVQKTLASSQDPVEEPDLPTDLLCQLLGALLSAQLLPSLPGVPHRERAS